MARVGFEPQARLLATDFKSARPEARRYPEAVQHLQRVLEVNPDQWVALLQLGKSYERIGKYEEALGAFRKASEAGGAAEALSLTGYIFAVSGRRQEGERILSELAARSERSYVPPYDMAVIYHGLGDADAALRWLERAYEERDPHVVLLGVEPRWDPPRADPRFQQILTRVGLAPLA